MIGIYALLTDLTSVESRTRRMSILEASNGIGKAIIYLFEVGELKLTKKKLKIILSVSH